MALNFQEYTKKGMIFLKEVAMELGTPNDLPHASRITNSVFHTLREVLTPDESFHLISQLPMYLKAVYVDGWKLSKSPMRIKKLDQFIDEVRSQTFRTADRDFGNNEQARKCIEAVFRVIKNHVSEGELKDVKQQMPSEILELWEA